MRLQICVQGILEKKMCGKLLLFCGGSGLSGARRSWPPEVLLPRATMPLDLPAGLCVVQRLNRMCIQRCAHACASLVARLFVHPSLLLSTAPHLLPPNHGGELARDFRVVTRDRFQGQMRLTPQKASASAKPLTQGQDAPAIIATGASGPCAL